MKTRFFAYQSLDARLTIVRVHTERESEAFSELQAMHGIYLEIPVTQFNCGAMARSRSAIDVLSSARKAEVNRQLKAA